MFSRFTLAILIIVSVSSFAHAQLLSDPPVPSVWELPTNYTMGSGGNLSTDGGMTNVNGTPGVNPGWTLFTYGSATGGSGRLKIDAITGGAASLYIWTADPGSPTTSGPAAGFNASNPYSWRIIDPKAGNTATLQIKANDILGDTTILTLSGTTPEDLATYNARLNQIFRFGADKWIDPSTNAAILSSAGTFSYSFSNYDTDMNQYRSIDLVYTPVPEPTLMLTAGAAVLAIVIKRRRRNVQPQ